MQNNITELAPEWEGVSGGPCVQLLCYWMAEIAIAAPDAGVRCPLAALAAMDVPLLEGRKVFVHT